MKIRCPDGSLKTTEWCANCNKCLPKPIKDALLPVERKRSNSEIPRFGVTRVTNKCLRSTYFDLTEEVVHDLEKLWVFSRGHAFHEHFKFDEKERFIKKNFGDFEVIGFIDAVHDSVIYELKTTNNIPEAPQEHHKLQAQAYYSMMSDEEKAKIKKILIVYLSLQKIKVFEVPKRDITEFLEKQGRILVTALKEKIPPNKTQSWLCNYCSHKDRCNGHSDDLFVSDAKRTKQASLI